MADVFANPFNDAQMRYGVMITPGLGMGYPDLKAMVQTIFTKRMAKLPWVPADWLAGVQALQAARPGDLIRVAPSRMADAVGTPQDLNPLFLDDDAKLDAWQSIYEDMNRAIGKYAAAQAAAGRAELDALYVRAAFWDAAYKITLYVAELPSNIAQGFGGLVKDFILGDLRKNYGRTILLVLALGVLVLFLVKPDLAKRWFGGLAAWFGRKFKGAARA